MESMTPTKEQIREQYLANQLFLIGEKVGADLEVIDRRANYIVVVNGSGETSKLFLDEAYILRLSETYSPTQGKTLTDLEGELHQVYKDYPEYHADGYHAMVDKFAGDPFYKLHAVAKEYLKSPAEYRKSPNDLKEGRLRFSSFVAKAEPAAFAYKGYKPRNFQNHPEAQEIFESLTKDAADPYAVLSALKHVDIFLEKRDEHSREIARKAVAKIDENLVDALGLALDLESAATRVESQTAERAMLAAARGLRMMSEDTIKDEEIDFQIEEKLTYSALSGFLNESFEHHVHQVLDHLEKNPKELDKLADHVKTIEHIAHHYDHHSVHMSESEQVCRKCGLKKSEHNVRHIFESEESCPVCKGTGEVATGIGMMPCDHCHPVECKNCKSTGLVDTGIGELPCPECHGARTVNESAEGKAIEHAEPGHRISVRKLSSGPQLVKVAKRAAVELIAQKLANKPIKKISNKEKNEIVKAIKSKKSVVMKLARKLVPKIRHIEHEHHEHSEEFGSAE
jgi:predicted Zn-ribbon and HTH transcriptional regulator